MIAMSDTLALYHGTTHDFAEIDVRRGKPYKDFGQGFYLAGTVLFRHGQGGGNAKVGGKA
jgi:hypothetical protein